MKEEVKTTYIDLTTSPEREADRARRIHNWTLRKSGMKHCKDMTDVERIETAIAILQESLSIAKRPVRSRGAARAYSKYRSTEQATSKAEFICEAEYEALYDAGDRMNGEDVV